MNGERETDVVDDVDDVEEDVSPEDTVVITEDMADIGDLVDTTELDIDELVEKLDKIDDVEHRKAVKRRLEELAERKREELELDSTYNFNLDDEV